MSVMEAVPTVEFTPSPIIGASSPVRPMICEMELAELARAYGIPLRRTYYIEADEYIRAYRWRAESDRRAEVVFALQDPTGKLWMHCKAHYPSHLSRLPSGGVTWDESIYGALLREIDEETGLTVQVQRFIGLLEYHFHHQGAIVKFASYLFHVHCDQPPVPPDSGEIHAFRAIRPSQLLQLTVDMRNMMGERRGWGQWRSLAHDVVYDYLSGIGPNQTCCAND